MPHNKYYGKAIWTNHALERLGQRGLSQELAWKAFRYPDQELQGKNPGTVELIKRFGPSLVTVIAKLNEEKQWIILSCWIDPPLPGSIDIKQKEWWNKYKKAGFWGKFWLEIKKQLGF